MKRFHLQEKQVFIAFRAILCLLLLFFGVYARNERADLLIASGRLYWLLGMVGFQFASNLILALAPGRLIRKGWGVGFFLLDLAAVSLAICWTQGFESDLFMIYFLVIFMTAVARKPAISFAAAALSCVLYAFLFLKTGTADGLLQPSILIRFPLLWVTAFFSSVIVENLEEEKKGMAREMEEQWERSERFAALGQLARNVAQELNNPLTSILGMSETLALHGGEFEEDVRVIERNARRCKTITADLERLAAGEPVALEPVDLLKPMEEAVELLQDRIRRAGLRVSWKADPKLGNRLVKGSVPHLRQSFYNLIANAIEAAPYESGIVLAVEKKSSLNERNVRQDFVEATVEDSGPGISREVRESFSDPRPIRAPEGFPGMGLTVAQNLIEKHRGGIGFEDRGEGMGTKVWVRLPSAALEEELRHETGIPNAA